MDWETLRKNIFKEKKSLEYISLLLVLSFLVFNQIFLVILGTIIACYCIYQDKFLDNIKKEIINKDFKEFLKEQPNTKVIESKLDLLNDKSSFRLVQMVEESGIIPIEDKINDEDKVA